MYSPLVNFVESSRVTDLLSADQVVLETFCLIVDLTTSSLALAVSTSLLKVTSKDLALTAFIVNP